MQAQKAAASNKAVLTTSKQPMNYLGSRDTTSIKRCLGGDDSMVQLFHRALGIALGAAVNCDFADLPQTWNGQVGPSLHNTLLLHRVNVTRCAV